MPFKYSFCCFHTLKTEGTLFWIKEGQLPGRPLLLTFSYCSMHKICWNFWHFALPCLWILNASKLMCKMLAENDFHRTEWHCIFGQAKRKAADALIAELQWTFLRSFESLRGIKTKLEQWYQATSFACRQQVEIKAESSNFVKVSEKCDFCSSETGNNFHLCSCHLNSNL